MLQAQRGSLRIMWIMMIAVVLAIGGGYYVMHRNAGREADSNPLVPTETLIPNARKKEIEERTFLEARKIVVTLAEQRNSGESGSATIESVGGQTRVYLRLNGAPKGAVHPAQIRSGSCKALGEVAYTLSDVVNGISETILTPPIGQMVAVIQTTGLALNIQRSADEAAVSVVCGDLQNPETLWNEALPETSSGSK